MFTKHNSSLRGYLYSTGFAPLYAVPSGQQKTCYAPLYSGKGSTAATKTQATAYGFYLPQIYIPLWHVAVGQCKRVYTYAHKVATNK